MTREWFGTTRTVRKDGTVTIPADLVSRLKVKSGDDILIRYYFDSGKIHIEKRDSAGG